MVPRVTSQGRSFKGAGAYFLHDLGRSDTAERVAFAHTVNMLTDDPETALKVMAWTAAHAEDLKAISGQKTTGRKAQNPVYNYCLAWAPDQDPSREDMIAFGMRSMEALGVVDHEALFVAHDDTPHKHLHVILNRVHPETGLMAKMSHDRNLLSRLAQSYEEETGRIYCAERLANNRRRDLGEPHVKADNVVRLMETPAYQARRAARLEAQRAAGERALARDRDEAARAEASQTLRADFDQAAGAADDRRYRAREIEPPRAEEEGRARQAWQAQQAEERAAQKRQTADLAVQRREQARRAQLEQRRQAEWERYAGQQWQRLDERHAARRETLETRLRSAWDRHEQRLARKYEEAERLAERRVDRLRHELASTGLQGLVDKLTGRRKTLTEALEAARAGVTHLERQKQQERDDLASRHRGQLEAEQTRREQDRAQLRERLEATRARQDARFEAQERARAERLARERQAANDRGGPDAAQAQRREAVRAVERTHVDQVAKERETRAEWAAFERPQRNRQRGYER